MLVKCFVSYILLLNFKSNAVIVQTANGKVRGILSETASGRTVYSFYGIRYAEPPTGKNRFKPPIPAKPWNGIFNATQQGQACLQSNPLPEYILTEDCLLLDVHSTDLSAKKPVMVLLHAGQFYGGAKSLLTPDYLLDKEITFVAMNFRLGAFGFLSTGTKHASGNQSYKDQTLALKWVRRNIGYFGGNPKLVTLYGYSSGGFAATMRLIAPMSYGLFERAVAMSGSNIAYHEPMSRRSSERVFKYTSCNKIDIEQSVECLRNTSAEEILIASAKLPSLVPWNYDIENESDPEPFVTDYPHNIASKGHIQKIPLLAGVVICEYCGSYHQYTSSHPEILFGFNTSFSEAAADLLLYTTYPNKDNISKALQSFYLNNEPLSEVTGFKFDELLSDSIVRHAVHLTIEYARRFAPVYYYIFEYQGRYSKMYKTDGTPLGVVHGDDLQYIFKISTPPYRPIEIGDREYSMIERMTSWLTQFVITGNPNNFSNPATNSVIWIPTDKEHVRCLHINEISYMSSEPYKERYVMWDDIFPLY